MTFSGDYYQLSEAILLPRPQRAGGPTILIGGNGPRRTLPLVARYASKWNGLFIAPEVYAERNARLDELLAEQGRQPRDVKRSVMTGCAFGRTAADTEAAASVYSRTVTEMRAAGMVAGSANEIVEQLGKFAEAGVERVMLQWLNLDDLDGIEGLAKGVLPQVHN